MECPEREGSQDGHSSHWREAHYMIGKSAIAAQMKDGLRRLARSVVVISTRDPARRYAMTATAVTELSLDPPSLLICVNRGATMFRPLEAGAGFCVNVLERRQEEISAACSGKLGGEDRFQVGKWAQSPVLAVPYLTDAQVCFVCRNERSLVHGTHGLFIGEVLEVHVRGQIDPLIYMDGGYNSILRRA